MWFTWWPWNLYNSPVKNDRIAQCVVVTSALPVFYASFLLCIYIYCMFSMENFPTDGYVCVMKPGCLLVQDVNKKLIHLLYIASNRWQEKWSLPTLLADWSSKICCIQIRNYLCTPRMGSRVLGTTFGEINSYFAETCHRWLCVTGKQKLSRVS